MNTELERIEAEALKLSADDRERLVEVLIDSLDHNSAPAPGEYGGFASAEIQRSWLDEAERRMHLVREGRMKTYPAEEVMARLEQNLNRLRREPQRREILSTELERIEADALKLSSDDRERLLERLRVNIYPGGESSGLPFSGFATPEIERAWIEECRRRFELMKSGEMATYPAEEVVAELMAEYGP